MGELRSFVDAYGMWLYPALFVYCLIKSGALPLFAGIGAANGLVDVCWVALATLAGGVVGDELRFWAARHFGERIIVGRPKLGAALAAARRLMERYGMLYLFIYRYPKGMRTIGALPVGLTDMPWHRFALLNVASAGLWALLMVGGGFFLGELIGPLAESSFGFFSVLLLLPVFIGSILIITSRRRSDAESTRLR